MDSISRNIENKNQKSEIVKQRSIARFEVFYEQ